MSEKEKKVFTVDELASRIGGAVIGDGKIEVCGVNSLEQAGGADITFISSGKHVNKLCESGAAAVIVKEKLADAKVVQLLVKNVDSSLIEVLNLFAPELTVEAGVHRTAAVEEDVEIGANVSIGAGAYVGHGVLVGDGCVLGAGCVVGENTKIGMNCKLDANVVVYHNCVIGNNCIIQANSTIGACGYGYSFIDGQHRLIPHNGGVIIEDCVEIGANCCVDRAKFGNTTIGAGTKIDDMVMIAHNVIIGRCCLLVGRSSIAGSTVLGDGVVMAGDAGTGDNCKIGDGVVVTTRATALRDFPAGVTISGTPARNMQDHIRQLVYIQRLPKMAAQLKELTKKVKELEASKDDKK
ncbi:MAG: UDP-3-O-(3-hydroxymyristoyl)glucosamine N-acyltransferase [Planctomycetes bacterium]|nr:UDP-3-O-(3-hydroxymyristoyl)glucosamine N-acyltransferase [Planctomycetota bacterium]